MYCAAFYSITPWIILSFLGLERRLELWVSTRSYKTIFANHKVVKLLSRTTKKTFPASGEQKRDGAGGGINVWHRGSEKEDYSHSESGIYYTLTVTTPLIQSPKCLSSLLLQE